MKPALQTRIRVVSSMRVAMFPIALALLLAQASQPQKIYDPTRVVLDYRCPTYALAGNTLITMRADLIGAKELLDEQQAKRIAFKWELSEGKLISGQGTRTILVDPSRLAKHSISCIDIKLEVEGAPPDVEREKTCTLRIDPRCTSPQMVDEYGGISHEDELQHLDRLAKYLKNYGPEATAYIVAYAGRSACIYESQWRADRAKNYLIEKHGLPRDRITEVDGGVRESWTVDLFIQSRGRCGPLANPTLPRDDSHVSGQCSEKYPESENR